MNDGKPVATQHYRLFETAFGVCAVAWSGIGLTRLQLPEGSAEATRQRIERDRNCLEAARLPVSVSNAIAELQRYFAGDRVDFAGIDCDLTGVSPFHLGLYAALRRIGWGETTTYGALASTVGTEGGARAIGQAMGRNPVPVIIPCHRVLASGGAIGGFSAPGGRLTKRRLLALESAGGAGLPLFDHD